MPRKSKRTVTMRKNKKVNRSKKMRGGVWYDPRSWFGNSTTTSAGPPAATEPAAEPVSPAVPSTTSSAAPSTTSSAASSAVPPAPSGPGGKLKKRVKRN